MGRIKVNKLGATPVSKADPLQLIQKHNQQINKKQHEQTQQNKRLKQANNDNDGLNVISRKGGKHMTFVNEVDIQDDETMQLFMKLSFANWYRNEWKSKVEKKESETLAPPHIVSEKSKKAEDILKQVSTSFNEANTGDTDDKWTLTVIRSGTLSDKLAALALRVQEAPLFRLESLFKILRGKAPREIQLSTDVLRDLFINNLLPDRKLKFLAERPLDSPNVSDMDLIYWVFEDKIKNYYNEFLQVVQKMTHDHQAPLRSSAVNHVYQLLASKPEQERMLLSMLVNKLGDVEKSVCSKAMHYLMKLTQENPGMRMHVCKEVELLVFRPNIPKRAQYYSVIFLNQYKFKATDKELATKLMEIYFRLFELILKDEVESKGEQNEKDGKKKHTKFDKNAKKKKKNNKFKKDKKAAQTEEESEESKIVDALLTGINRAFPYSDKNLQSYVKYTDTLYRLVHVSNFPKGVHCLQLLHQLSLAQSGQLSDRYFRALYDILLVRDLHRSTKVHTIFLNLVFKSLKADININRLRAIVKRILQISMYAEPNFICAVLFMVSKLMEATPALRHGVESQEVHEIDNNTSTVQDDDDEEDGNASNTTGYNPFKREPMYANAHCSGFWELNCLLNHYHASVGLFSEKILNSEPIEYTGDPIHDFDRNNFFDRFVFKTPKKRFESQRGISPMQPTVRLAKILNIPIDSEEYSNLNPDSIPKEELFFYKFMKENKKFKPSKKKKIREDDEIEDIEDQDIDDEEFEKALRNEMKANGTMGPEEEEEDIDEEEDLNPEDFEDMDDEDLDAALMDDDDEGMDDMPEMDDDEFNNEDFDMADEDASEEEEEGSGKKKKKKSAFASLDDFEHLLQQSGSDYAGVNDKQLAWELRTEKGNNGPRGKKRKHSRK